MPVLIGVGQTVHRAGQAFSPSPIQMMAEVAKLAISDSAADHIADNIDCVTITRFMLDAPGSQTFPFGHYQNPPKSVAHALGINPQALVYGPTGGNTPQMLVNLMAERIAQGQHQLVLLAGCEALHSLIRALKMGKHLPWNDKFNKDGLEDLGANEIDGSSDNEIAHGLHFPINAYPLFENAIRKHYQRSIDEHQQALGELMAPFSQVAAQHPQAWFPKARSPQEISTMSRDNRYVGFPYTKYMNAIMRVDQAAALLMTNVETAQKLNVPQSKWIFLHGCGDAHDLWYLSQRVNYYSSHAIKLVGQNAFDMAGWNIDDIDLMDLYSCFPSAVQIAKDALAIPEHDRRALTVTGGLPYFGGAGNNYSMHSIATMIEKLRARPKSKGFCTANGYFMTKHSIGLYSAEPKKGAWQQIAPEKIQAEIDATPHPEIARVPQGKSVIKTYTVIYGRKNIEHGLIIGQLQNQQRFCAHVHDPKTLDRFMTEDCFGLVGDVKTNGQGLNIWTPAS